MPLIKLLFLFLVGSVIGATTIYSIPLERSVTPAPMNFVNTHEIMEQQEATILNSHLSENQEQKNKLESELLELKNSFSDVMQRISNKRKKLHLEKDARSTEA